MAADFSPEQLEFFERRIRPVLVDRCYSCHSSESKKLKGDLHLDSREALLKGGETGKPSVVPGDPGRSLLIEAVGYANQDLQMPPKGKLPPEVVADLTEWVKQGAPWPAGEAKTATGRRNEFDVEKRRSSHWAWSAIQRPEPPSVSDASWPVRPVDRFVLSRLEKEGLRPAPPASKALLLRRLYFDLVGFPPDPRAVAAFEADTSPEATRTVVEQLLSSPEFGERWARHWLDLVRYAETLAHEFDYPRHNAWRYRDYVIRALNADVPYDQFVREHIAGDLLREPRRNPEDGSNESLIGTAFYWFGQQTHSPVDVQMHQAEFVDNQIDVLSKTFLGLTVACARCHDHKFDAIATRDFYSLYGVLTSSRYAQRIIDDPKPVQGALERLGQLRPGLTPVLWNAMEVAAGSIAARLQERATNAGIQKLREQFPAPETLTGSNAPDSSSVPDAGLAATFRHASLPPGWSVDGPAFENAFVPEGEWVVGLGAQKPAARLMTESGMHSGKWSRRLQGSLRSPTQVISNKFLHIRCSGRDSRFNVVIANFTIIQAPIYGDLRRVMDFDEPRWVTVPLERWKGLRAYVEFNDLTAGDPGGGGRGSYGPNGWLAVHQVAWSDTAEPPSMSVKPSVPAVADAATWAQAVQAAALREVARGKAGTLETAGARFLDALLATEALPLEAVDATLKEFQEVAGSLKEPRLVPAMVEGTPFDEHVFIRGSPRTPGELVPRRFLEALNGVERGPYREGSGRAELADRLLEPSNPFTARVLVNRAWLHLFGRGIVPTPDDFGVLGQPPSHPELLDYLADWFRTDGGWSVKKLIGMLTTSRAYAMASVDGDPKAQEKDPENVLLHRANVRRLEGEIIRDSLLRLSGRLDPAMYGPSVPTHLTDFMDGRGRPGSSGPLDGAGRRSIYLEVRNNFLSPFMRTFDMPVPFTTVGRRTLSNVPAQSLILMNDPFVLDQARLWAERSLKSAPALSASERVVSLYESAYGRKPVAAELEAAAAFLRTQTAALGTASDKTAGETQVWTDLCHALVNVKEFVYIY